MHAHTHTHIHTHARTGADRHYTTSYSDFYRRLRSDAYFAGWLRPMYEDVIHLMAMKPV